MSLNPLISARVSTCRGCEVSYDELLVLVRIGLPVMTLFGEEKAIHKVIHKVIYTLFRIRTTPHQDNSPPYKYWS